MSHVRTIAIYYQGTNPLGLPHRGSGLRMDIGKMDRDMAQGWSLGETQSWHGIKGVKEKHSRDRGITRHRPPLMASANTAESATQLCIPPYLVLLPPWSRLTTPFLDKEFEAKVITLTSARWHSRRGGVSSTLVRDGLASGDVISCAVSFR